jgi:tetratricopeptide (TPR) repeat protein
MSPEQATGSQVDGRTDVYALGCVVYETLAGEPPFTGPTPQAVIARRFLGPAPSLHQLRPDMPAWLDAAVAKAMAQVPADRFATAAEFARALGAAVPGVETTGRVGGRRARLPRALRSLTRRRALLGAALIFAGVGMLAAGYLALRTSGIGREGTLLAAGALEERGRVLLADFQNRTPDSLLSSVVTEAFRIDLAQSSAVTLVPAARVTEVLGRMQRSPAARLDPAVAREVAVREGITGVVTGEIGKAGPQYLLSAQLISAAGGEVLAALRETAPDSTALIVAVDRLSNRLRARIGESLRSIGREQPLERVTTGSLAALRKYTRAVRAGDHEGDQPKAIALLEEAVELDTGFAMAYRALGMYAMNVGQMDRVMRAYSAAIARSDRLTERERQATLGDYHAIVTRELPKAAAAYEALLEDHPYEREALNNLALVYWGLAQRQRAESLFMRAVAADSSYQQAHNNLILLQVELRRWAGAESSYGRAIRQLPGVPDIRFAGVVLAERRGDYTTAETRARALKQQFDDHPYWRANAERQLGGYAALRGRLRDAERYLRGAMASRAEASRPDDYLHEAILLGAVFAAVGGEPERGVREVTRALARVPLDSLKTMDRPYLGLSYVHVLAGKAGRVRAIVTEYERAVDPSHRNRAKPSLDLAWGRVAMAERRWRDAVARMREATAGAGSHTAFGLPELGRAYDLAAQPDSAIALYERYLANPGFNSVTDGVGVRSSSDATELAGIYRRLGVLYEERGDRERSAHYYSRFIELWKDCDPELQPRVAEARRRLAALGGAPTT